VHGLPLVSTEGLMSLSWIVTLERLTCPGPATHEYSVREALQGPS
jgi:hypothetical protein